MDRDKALEQAEKLARDNKPDKALKEFQKILADDPNNMRVKLKVAELLAKKKETEKAITTYREVGNEYETNNFHLKAIAVYKTILLLNPTLIDINEKLGHLYHKVGLDKEAVHQLLIVASHYDSQGLNQEALEIHKTLATLAPDNVSLITRLAELYQSAGKIDASILEYEKAAVLFKKKNDIKGLVEIYQKVLFRKPGNIPMFRALIKIYLDCGEKDKVLKAVEKAPEEAKKDLMVRQIWAEALVAAKQMEAGRRLFKELYQNLVALKDDKQCAQLYSRILQEFQDDPDYMAEVDAIRTEAKFAHPILKPSHREDMERTTLASTDSKKN